jgi:transcriptional regulator with GAF, ATPase, and Fis domain
MTGTTPGVAGSDEANDVPEPDTGPQALSDQDDDLTQSLASLSMLATGQLALEDSLTQVAGFAVRAIPGADGAGLTLLEADRADTIVSTADFVTKVDKIQYSLGEGPCISAASEGHTFWSGSLGGEQRWPRFGPRVARLGVHSVLSLPLLTPDGVLGAMNVYAHSKAVFDERAVNIGELFAVPAAIAVQNALVLAQAKRLASNLQAALISRAVIDQAMGIVMSRTGCNAEEAFDRLRTRSQTEHVKVSAVAQSVVDAAVRRARARRAIEDPPAT